MSQRRDLLRYLRDLGWSDALAAAGGRRDRDGAPASAAEDRRVEPASADSAPDRAAPAAAAAATGQDPCGSATLDDLAAALEGCRRCRLCEGRRTVVFGVGSPTARLLFVGEGPGAEEDRRGEPFVGRAGQLLNAMLRAIDLARDDVYIANVVKCRPPRNRDPQDDEVATCLPFLRRQIELIDPDVIVTLGRVAARHLLGISAPISSYRGRWLQLGERDVLPTFHPAYLLRNPAAKVQAWSDLKAVRERLRRATDG